MLSLLKPVYVLLDSSRSLLLSNDRMGKSPVCQLHIHISFATTKWTETELILNTSVKKRRTNLLVPQMVGPRHGVSDANSWSVPPMIECCTFGIFQVFWGLPLCVPLCGKSSTTKKIHLTWWIDVKENISTSRQSSYFWPKMGWDVSH